MATKKRIKPRRSARKQKFIEINGHRLTPGMHAKYQEFLASRRQTNRGYQPWQIEELALGDLFGQYRISCTSKDQLHDLYSQVGDISLAIMNFADYPFFAPNNTTTRRAGCDALSRLAVELHVIGEKVYLIEEAIRYEAGEKVQDWQARQKVIDEVSWPPPGRS